VGIGLRGEAVSAGWLPGIGCWYVLEEPSGLGRGYVLGWGRVVSKGAVAGQVAGSSAGFPGDLGGMELVGGIP
jgi:hypothetical protein